MPIRSWNANDLPQINSLLKDLSQTINFNYHNDINLLKKHYETILKNPDCYSTFVYELDGNVVGFISLVQYTSVLHHKGTALLNELVVAKEFQRKGIGGKLLSFCMEYSYKNGWDEIEVGAEIFNTKAIEFYRKNGFDREYILLGKEFD